MQARGHRTIAPDLPCDNDRASLDDYAGTVVDAVSGRQDLVIVGQSYGAFTATLVASQLPVRLLVLLAGMIPTPGESPGQWWGNTDYRQAVEEQAKRRRQNWPRRPLHQLLQRCAAPTGRRGHARGGRGESSTVWNTPWPLDAWPKRATKFILCKDYQFPPLCGGWHRNALAPSPTRFPAVIAPRSATRRN